MIGSRRRTSAGASGGSSCSRRRPYYSVAILLSLLVKGYDAAQPSYANVTLQANNGDLSVVVFLPQGIKPNERTYYMASRFDHSSMIGKITRKIRRSSSKGGGGNDDDGGEEHVLYDTKQWRAPHDPYWPESGVGLASEFGVGDDGSFCNYRCGWYEVNEVTNGVLGYRQARNGESFLKLGVGELIKGSCSTCDSTDDFKFNSPYKFAKTPKWRFEEHPEDNSIVLEQEIGLNEHGYRLTKRITLNDDELLVKTTLMNLGRVPFATAWYSHHFFTCDAQAVGVGYDVDLDLTGTAGKFEEPGTWFWSTPLRRYAQIKPSEEKVAIEMVRGVENNIRIKAEFVKDETSHGSFTMRACGTSIAESIPEVGQEGSGVSMYAFNLYIESGTFSPEPQIYLHLYPGQTTSWTQRLQFSDLEEHHGNTGSQQQPPSSTKAAFSLKTIASPPPPSTGTGDSSRHVLNFGLILFMVTGGFIVLSIHSLFRRGGGGGLRGGLGGGSRWREKYQPIPDHDHDDDGNDDDVNKIVYNNNDNPLQNHQRDNRHQQHHHNTDS